MRKIFLLSLLSVALLSSKVNAQVGRWYSYADYIVNNSAVTTGSYNVYSHPIWNDTTSKFYYFGGTPDYYRNYQVSTGVSFAPRLTAWDNVTDYGSSIKVGPTDAFTIDSVRIQGTYLRNNLLTAPRDTIRIAFVYGIGTSTSNIVTINTTPPAYGAITPIDILYDSVKNIIAKNPTVATPSPYVQSIVLSNTDTATTFYRAFALTTPYAVPAGQTVGTSLTFKSGDASYVPNDTIRYASGLFKHGAFLPHLISYADGAGSVDWAPYSTTDSNMGYFKTKPQTNGWSGYYVPQWAWVSGTGGPSYMQFPIMEFHVKCVTCRLNDVITGSAAICVGATTTMAHSLGGGAWSSSTTAVGTVSSGGVVGGISAGTTTITYTVSGNFTTRVVTVTGLPPAGTLVGATSVCEGSMITLTPTVSGGTWSSGATTVATVDGFGNVSGVTGGTAIISYITTNACGSSAATRIVTVNPLPGSPNISGASAVCVGTSTTLTGTPAGGTWSTLSGLVTIIGTGTVTGVTAGVDFITYTVSNGCGTAFDTALMTIDPAPSAGTITGASTVCIGAAIILTPTVAGGTWSASNGNATVTATGDVTGVTAGPVNITYTVTSSCGAVVTSHTVTVNDCSTGSVYDIDNALGTVSIFPNPTHDNITITSTKQIKSIVVSNVMGQKVMSANYNTNNVTINLSSLPQGIYTIKVNDTKAYKVVKQ